MSLCWVARSTCLAHVGAGRLTSGIVCFGIISDMPSRSRLFVLNAHDPAVSTILSRYADQLDQIETSIATLATSAGDHNGIIAHVSRSIGSAAAITRSASVVIESLELHCRHTVRVKKAVAQGQ